MKFDFFVLPKAYPDETWYSLLARYHRHSGNIHSAETRRELFGEPVIKSVNPMEVDYSIVRYIQMHGPTHGTDEECISKYTLAPYHLRYYSVKRKEELLSKVRNSDYTEKISLATNYEKRRSSTFLRYCPVCLHEDMLKHGESYWHRSHQIWLVDKCPIHRCKLKNSTVTLTRASYHFTCAGENACPDKSIDYEPSTLDRLAPYVVATLDAPFSFHETAVTDSLVNAALDAGYGEYRSKGFICKAAKLDEDIRATYGDNFISEFITSNTEGATFRRVFYHQWNSKIEPAMLLAAFFQIPVKELFKKEDREAKIRKEFIRCAKNGFRWPRANLARHLGIKESRLYKLAEELNIEPFWGLKVRQENLIEMKVKLFMTKEERDLIEQKIVELNAVNRREFVWYCVRKELGVL